jgi:hypothetical protein
MMGSITVTSSQAKGAYSFLCILLAGATLVECVTRARENNWPNVHVATVGANLFLTSLPLLGAWRAVFYRKWLPGWPLESSRSWLSGARCNPAVEIHSWRRPLTFALADGNM